MDGRGETFSTILRLLNLSRSKITRLIVVISILEKSSFEKVGATYLAFVFYAMISRVYRSVSSVASEQSRKEKRIFNSDLEVEATLFAIYMEFCCFIVGSRIEARLFRDLRIYITRHFCSRNILV